MRHDAGTLGRAAVAAGFETQDAADEAVLELENLGVSHRRIGYYAAAERGHMTDLMASHHRFAASVLWGGAGAALGVGAVVLLDRMGVARLDPFGLVVTVAAFGALAMGTAGGVLGLWADRREDVATPVGVNDAFVVAVETPDAGRVREVLLRRGGHLFAPT